MSRNFSATHQWLRELKRFKNGPLVAIDFRIADEESVCIGHYAKYHRWMTASEAVAAFQSAHDPFGWETIIPRKIESHEIRRVRSVPQVVGWRFSPKSKGKRPFCTCKFCTRGEYGSQKLRERRGSPDG